MKRSFTIGNICGLKTASCFVCKIVILADDAKRTAKLSAVNERQRYDLSFRKTTDSCALRSSRRRCSGNRLRRHRRPDHRL